MRFASGDRCLKPPTPQPKETKEVIALADIQSTDREDDAEMMSDGAMKRLIEYLKSVGWSDTEIVKLMKYIAGK